jgi:hypothetical protein
MTLRRGFWRRLRLFGGLFYRVF